MIVDSAGIPIYGESEGEHQDTGEGGEMSETETIDAVFGSHLRRPPPPPPARGAERALR